MRCWPGWPRSHCRRRSWLDRRWMSSSRWQRDGIMREESAPRVHRASQADQPSSSSLKISSSIFFWIWITSDVVILFLRGTCHFESLLRAQRRLGKVTQVFWKLFSCSLGRCILNDSDGRFCLKYSDYILACPSHVFPSPSQVVTILRPRILQRAAAFFWRETRWQASVGSWEAVGDSCCVEPYQKKSGHFPSLRSLLYVLILEPELLSPVWNGYRDPFRYPSGRSDVRLFFFLPALHWV